MKKVLIITYYWPPAGGGGVQRWLKFVKYLRKFNWEPLIYTVANPNYPATDASLGKDVPENIEIIKQPIWEPYDLYRKFTGRSKKEGIKAAFTSEKKTNTALEKISNFVRSNYFIPDARKFWVKPSVKFLSHYLTDNKIDVVVTTGPPHSLHLIGLKLKNKLNINWLADFRDPWTNIDYYKELLLTSWADKKHHRLEKQVLQHADKILVVGENMKVEFSEHVSPSKIEVITNGFDYDDDIAEDVKQDSKFSITHLGVLMRHRNPLVLWKALSELCETNTQFKNDLLLKLYGNVDYEIRETIEKYGLMGNTKIMGYVAHDEVLKTNRQSQVLLLLINRTGNAKGMLTGKLFEYLLSGRPILAIGPEDGDAANILNESKAGVMSDFNDVEKLKSNILNYYELHRNGELKVNAGGIDKFSRENLTKSLAGILNEMIRMDIKK